MRREKAAHRETGPDQTGMPVLPEVGFPTWDKQAVDADLGTDQLWGSNQGCSFPCSREWFDLDVGRGKL